jgi:NAD(P)-dependent dehydrogenase (short-subunit alcohol dehydrogenase family)
VIQKQRLAGSISHVSSVAAKAALHEFVRWLAFENAPHNIRCNVLMLGMIDTPMAIEGYHQATGAIRADFF